MSVYIFSGPKFLVIFIFLIIFPSYSISFYFPIMRMLNKVIKDTRFVNLEQMKTRENDANTKCFIK